MPPKQAVKGHEEALNEESKVAIYESKRLQELAYKGMLSENRRMFTEELTPSKVLQKADGKDITKKSSLRKGRYLLNINGQIAAAAEGRMGALSQLDTRNPVLYIDFPEGRLKFLGTLMFPANKYMVLKFGNRDILCEDILDSMVVFLEAHWIGTKGENPEEHKLPMPLSIIEAGKKAQEAADTDVVPGTQITANSNSDQAVRPPGSPRKRRATVNEDDSSSGNDDEDEDGPSPAMGRRPSQRSAAKRVKYDVDLSDGDASDAEDEDDDKHNDSGGRFRKLKRQAPKPAAARKLTLQSSQDDTSPQQDAEPGSSAENLGRRQSIAATGNGHLETVHEEAEEDAGGPNMTQNSAPKTTQTAKAASTPGGRKTPQPAKRKKLAKIVSDDGEDDDDIIDLSSQPSPAPASMSKRPRRTSSIVRPSMKEASSQDESEDAIEKENSDEDFLA